MNSTWMLIRRPQWFALGGAVLILAVFHKVFWLALSLLLLAWILLAGLQQARQHVIEEARDDRPGWRGMRWVLLAVVATWVMQMTILMPPLQSPDEESHLQRAYSLLDNHFLIAPNSKAKPENQEVDNGLRTYISAWQYQLATKAANRVTPQLESAMRKTRFSGSEAQVFNGGAGYMPVLYAPSALGLGLGRALGQPIWVSYGWARMLNATAALFALALALAATKAARYTIGAVALLPMTLQQFSSTNLDGMTISLGLLVLALMTRGAYGGAMEDRVAMPRWVRGAAWLLMALLVVSKPIFLALLGPPILWALFRKGDREHLIHIVGVLLLLGLWMWHMGQNFVDIRVDKPVSTFASLGQAMASPISTLQLIFHTLSVKADFYWRTMVGVLGWLDTPMTNAMYRAAAVLLGGAFIADALSANPLNWKERSWFVIAFMGYVLLTLVILLSAWVPASGGVIDGVQGRYFLPTLPLLAAGLGWAHPRLARWALPLFAVVVFGYLLVLTSDLPRILLYRFWL